MKDLIILQTTVPDYRKGIFLYLKSTLGESFKLYTGSSYFEKSITTDQSISFLKPIKNQYFFNRNFLFQTGMWQQVYKNNVMVLEMNPRIISNWLILFVRRILFRKTVVWGHAWPREGAKSKSDAIRQLMRLLGNEVIVYTKTQANELKTKMPRKIINAAPNALYFKNAMKAALDSKEIKHLIYVGRLSKPKKALFLVKSFHKAMSIIPEDSKLIIVGEGKEKQAIEDYIDKNNLKDRILIKGHVSELKTLEKLYATSLFSVSPGYVGLSITQSFSFGVPMIISRDEKHSPEIEAASEELNSIFFETDDLDALKDVIIKAYSEKPKWVTKREEIYLFCRNTYSIEAMGKTFLNILK